MITAKTITNQRLHVLAGFTFALAVAACGAEQGYTYDAESNIVSTPVDPVLCWVPVASDVTGNADHFSLRNSPVIATSPASCRGLGGAIFGNLPDDDDTTSDRGLIARDSRGLSAAAAGGLSAGGKPPRALQRDVRRSGVHDGTWVKDTHDCDDFADELERYLTDLGYDATYTELYWKTSSGFLGLFPKYSGHAITDVHIDDKTYWFEPQTGLWVNLDVDGDGDVDTSPPGDKDPGEGDYAIHVYDDLAERVSLRGSPD